MKWVTKNEVNRAVYPQLNKINNDVYFRYIPKSIKDSMILWYDIQRQGATNENMAINPILKDLSGNGHDATCYSFGWGGMSGVDGYVTNYNNYVKYSGVEVNDHVITSTTVEEGRPYNWLVFIDAKTNEVPSYKIRVTGTTAQTGLTYRYVDENNTVQYFSIPEDGEYTLPAIHRYSGDNINQNCGFQINQREPLLIIEQLPEYPGALVSDGVDDYAMVERLPILTKEKGYTVIAKRKWLNVVNDVAFVTKSFSRDDGTGAFIIERVLNNIINTYSYGKNNVINDFQSDITTIAQTSSYYNSTEIVKGDGIDSDRIDLFKFASNNNRVSCIALYSFLLFDRDLTEEEIEWVKNNLIENNTEA